MPNVRRYAPGTPVWVNLDTAAGTTAASKFYGGLFGWTARAWHRPLEDSSHWWVFVLDGRDVGSVAPGPHPILEMYMSVDNADETARVVVHNGGALVLWLGEIDGISRLAVCTDPLGARFGLWEPKGHPAASRMHEPNSFTWGELSCRDIDAAKDFYGAVFGWEGRTRGVADGSTYTEFFLPDVDQAVAGMVQMNQRWPQDVPPHWMLYFAVADTDEIVSRVGQLGGMVSVAPYDLADVGRIAVLNDPEGAVFSVLQRR
jgi:predicted enzyme related to lactoylglutathione lyase